MDVYSRLDGSSLLAMDVTIIIKKRSKRPLGRAWNILPFQTFLPDESIPPSGGTRRAKYFLEIRRAPCLREAK
jgi:hypothetical protein